MAGIDVAKAACKHIHPPDDKYSLITMASSLKSSDKELFRYRIDVTLRILFAVIGGYALTSLAAIFLSYALPLSKSDAVVLASTLSFALYTGAIIWVFSVKSLRSAGLGLAVPSLVLGALILTIQFARGGL